MNILITGSKGFVGRNPAPAMAPYAKNRLYSSFSQSEMHPGVCGKGKRRGPLSGKGGVWVVT